MTIGAMLLDAAARQGYYGLFSRLSGPQVRGGEAAALLRLGVAPIGGPPDHYDLLVAIDWGHVERFAAEIPMQAGSLIVGDPKMGEAPEAMTRSGASRVAMPFAEIAGTIPGGRPNMVALGSVAAMLGLDVDIVKGVLAARIGSKGGAAVESSTAAMLAGHALPLPEGDGLVLGAANASSVNRWIVSGNEASALGALRGGVRFVAGYPITPATEVVEWLAPVLPKLGGTMVQAEDELSAIGMTLGASFGGTPSMTVTSGPGLSLMIETLGLATAAEIPAVVIDVMRGGPSTGIPTKSEQSDLDLAVHGAHGDAPRVVLAPLSVGDCLPTVQWAVELAEALQVPVIVLSDQSIGQTRSIIDAPPTRDSAPTRSIASGLKPGGYKRYALTDSGVSPMAIPGEPHGQWIGEGLTHSEAGTPSSAARDHLAQMEKRLRKLHAHEFGDHWADISGEGEWAVITWGSTAGAMTEALGRLGADGSRFRHIALRLLSPIPMLRMETALQGVQRILVVELNQGGQLARQLRGSDVTRVAVESHARPGPLPLRPRELADVLTKWSAT